MSPQRRKIFMLISTQFNPTSKEALAKEKEKGSMPPLSLPARTQHDQ